MKNKKIILTATKPWKAAKGHQPHLAAGTHSDRRTKRLKTRSAKLNFELKVNYDSNYSR
jgi:hypothetical protein